MLEIQPYPIELKALRCWVVRIDGCLGTGDTAEEAAEDAISRAGQAQAPRSLVRYPNFRINGKAN